MQRRTWVSIALVISLSAGFLYREVFIPVDDSRADPIFFEVAAREPLGKVAADLKEKNLIRGTALFSWYGKLTGRDTEIKAGRFRLDPKLSPAEILRFLANPENGEISVTIPEGFTIFDIDARLAELGVMNKGEFAAWARGADLSAFSFVPNGAWPEGYFFPDTYFIFSKNSQPKDLGSAMLTNFKKKVVDGLAEDLKKNARTLTEIITMGSILEKEVRTQEDYALVAGILWKRLQNGWLLQADATALYGKSDRTLSRNELREDSSYNTYTRRGLPETPIGNPGLATIQAAINPTDSPYWFYLTGTDGKAVYARTNEEQNANRQKHL